MPKQGEIGARLVNGDVELVFEWVDDRFRQVFTFGERRLVSFDADAKAGHIPAFIEVHQQGDVIFASGASSGCHWSASVSPDGGGFLFDVAARITTLWQVFSVYDGACWLIEAIDTDGSSPDVSSVNNAGERWIVEGLMEPVDLPATVRYRYRVSAAP